MESEGIELVHMEYQKETAVGVFGLYIDKPGASRWTIVPL